MLPNGDGLGAEAPNALLEPNVFVPEEDPNGEVDVAAGVDPKALPPELDANGEFAVGAGAAPKGLAGTEPDVGAELPKGLGAAVTDPPKLVGGLESVASEEPNEGFDSPVDGREEVIPLPKPKDAVGAGAGADVVEEEEVIGFEEAAVDFGASSDFSGSSNGLIAYHFVANALNICCSFPLYLAISDSAWSARDGLYTPK